MSDLAYYIGVDHREPEALRVTETTAAIHASRPLPIRRLEHMELRRQQLFDRPWRICEDGTYLDERDGRPFSVQFSHSRFLTPIVAKRDGFSKWALFTDCDWLWLRDPWKLLEYADPSKTVMVVPHNFQPANAVKMDGQSQFGYNCKLWSALMLWNLESDKLPTVKMVNEESGSYLHKFCWLDQSDIGHLPETWHWIPNHSPTTHEAKHSSRQLLSALHFTHGPPVPGMVNREATIFDDLWKEYLKGSYKNES